MYSWISPTGEKIRTRTVKEFATKYNFPESHARDLACGYMKRYRKWCSGHKRAAKARKRFTTVLVNFRLGKREILGQTVTAFAAKHQLCKNELYKLINGRKIMYRGWMLERTHNLAQGTVADSNF
jgi:hypothetical protein